jgi:RES domain-containing protein
MRPHGGVWYRAIPPRFITTALNVAHTKTVPGRFNDASPIAPSFPVLYLAENSVLALFEVQALFGSPRTPGGLVSHPKRSATILNVTVTLNNLTDLTNLREQLIFDTNAQELTGDWRGFKLRSTSTSVTVPTGTAPTQELGAALYAVPALEGFLTISAKLPDQMILVVFPDKLLPGSSITHTDALGNSYPLTS